MRAMLIDVYTREQAIEDGVLVDVSTLAKEAGFKWPVAVTKNVNGVLNDIPEEFDHQDYNGRLWDVLFMGAMAIRKSRGGEELNYSIICQHELVDNEGEIKVERDITLKLVVHGGDNMEPVITIDRLH